MAPADKVYMMISRDGNRNSTRSRRVLLEYGDIEYTVTALPIFGGPGESLIRRRFHRRSAGRNTTMPGLKETNGDD